MTKCIWILAIFLSVGAFAKAPVKPAAKPKTVSLPAPKLVGLTTEQKINAINGATEKKMLFYLHHMVEWAKLHEADGDAFAAIGDNANAMVHYYKALGEVGAGAQRFTWKTTPDPEGVKVTEVPPGKRAERTGFKVGDVVVAVDGVSLKGLDEDTSALVMHSLDAVPNRPQTFSVKRDGKMLSFTADRLAYYKDLTKEEAPYRDALEQKILQFMIAKKIQPIMNDSMKWSMKTLTQDLKDAKSTDDIQFAAENIRGATYASPGWADGYFNCGVLMESANTPTEAEKCYKNFLLMKPNDPQAKAITARFSNLGNLVREEQNLRAWEGIWTITTPSGEKTDRGYNFERIGKVLKVKNHVNEQWLSGSIDDEFTATALQTLTSRGVAGGSIGNLIDKCFNGKLDAAGTLKLSPDKQTMTVTINNDVDIDPATCKIVRQNPSTLLYKR